MNSQNPVSSQNPLPIENTPQPTPCQVPSIGEDNAKPFVGTVPPDYNTSQPPPSPYYYQSYTPKPKEVYSKKDGIIAFLCIIPSYIMVSYTFLQPTSLYCTIFNLLFIIIMLCYIKSYKVKIKISHYGLFLISAIFSLSFFYSNNNDFKFLSGIFSFSLAPYIMYIILGNQKEAENPFCEAFSKKFLIEFFYSILVIPFRGFSSAPMASISIFKSTVKLKKIGYILLGLFLGIPITLIVAFLLISADENYKNMLLDFFSHLNLLEIILFILKLSIAIPFSYFLFGMLFANVRGKNTVPKSNYKSLRVVPSIVLYSSVTPICILYILFFVTGLKYFLSAFFGTLPENFSYSEYARQGFFELCVVAAINMGLVVFINIFIKKKEDMQSKNPFLLNVYSSSLVFFTTFLLITAFSKMALYIESFGLSPLRIYSLWFMTLLFLVFVVIFIFGIIKRCNFWKGVFAVFTVMLSLLCFSDIDGFIAKTNIEMYKKEKLTEVDVNLFYSLSDSAVKYAITLADDPLYANEINRYLSEKHYKYTSDDPSIKNKWSDWNFLDYEARKILREYFKKYPDRYMLEAQVQA